MIRKYNTEDLETIMDIWYKSSIIAHPFLEDDFVDMVRKTMRDLYIPKSKTWIYEHNENPVGFISMIGNEIGGLFILPEYFGQKTGTQLVNFIITLYDSIEVDVFEKNKIGRAFYDHYGFKFVKKYFHQESQQEVLRLRYSKKESILF